MKIEFTVKQAELVIECIERVLKAEAAVGPRIALKDNLSPKRIKALHFASRELRHACAESRMRKARGKGTE